jgi:uncharacterized repeat protein (TIGR03837 family)
VSAAPPPQRWDLFCRVVDNLGDAAIMWRLARQLAAEQGCRVRLFIDQPAVLRRLQPGRIDGVAVHPMVDAETFAGAAASSRAALEPDVVVSGFHAALPPAYRGLMTPGRPAWINLEYLSAEAWIDGFHGLPSPQPDGLTQHYFYPGFTARSGGLIREADLLPRRDAFGADPHNAQRVLASLGVTRIPGCSLASLLCYPGSPLDALAHHLAGSDSRLQMLVPAGASGPVDGARLQAASGGRLRISEIPFLAQHEYDRLLWSCDLNFVRGEDSWVRAIWSGRPFVWQIYKQAEAAHLPKLDAFLKLLATPPGARIDLAEACRWWNEAPGAAPAAMIEVAARPALAAGCLEGLAGLFPAPDLASRLVAFAAGVRA